ncbi:type I restriction-modification system subunit M N-terminal domain-containing protein, partial [Bacillus cereus]|uniref:type I restriction-modification system subunit M N-terminal domain-containing protein n=1 Tax=Bacillus cereus TaxID=1396 RepID=UPI002ABFD721
MNEVNRNLQTTINIQEKATLIWNIADILRGLYKPHEYGEVILPMTVIKRFHDTLLPTREAVLSTYEDVKELEIKDGFLTVASGYSFYNLSPFTFESLLANPAHIEKNFRWYLNGFSQNVQDILENFKFDAEISTLAENDKLYYVLQEFNS